MTSLLLLMLMMMQVSVAVVETMTSHARRLLVLVQVTAQRKRFAAATADVRLVGRVRLDVRSQVRLVGESLAALRALAALTVRPHVHAVGRCRRVDLVAVRTFARRGDDGGCVVVASVWRCRTATLLLLLLLLLLMMMMMMVLMVLTVDGRGTVALPVSGQVAGGAVRSAAL